MKKVTQNVCARTHTYDTNPFKFSHRFVCYCHQKENKIEIASAPCGFLFYINRTTATVQSYLGFYKIPYGIIFNIQIYRWYFAAISGIYTADTDSIKLSK
jgi:hypothetical protein